MLFFCKLAAAGAAAVLSAGVAIQSAQARGAQASTSTKTATTSHPANDTSVFEYVGRWAQAGGSDRKSDWPCTAVRFDVDASSNDCSVELSWGAIRSRVLVKVVNKATGALIFNDTLSGSSIGSASNPPSLHYTVKVPTPGSFTVEFKKLTEGAPFALGVGRLLSPSVLTFRGISSSSSSCAIGQRGPASLSWSSPKRAIDFYGASDTAGYCVDGNPKMNVLQCEFSWGSSRGGVESKVDREGRSISDRTSH